MITVPGGFDCSGLVWRVFKLCRSTATAHDVLEGRTTYTMSGEVGKALRLDPATVQPGDAVLRLARAALEAVGDRALGDLRRQRVVRALPRAPA